MRPQKIYELFNTADGITYRYKENVPVLSNLTGATRGAGPTRTLFLSREIPPQGANDQVESLVLSGTALLQLTSDNPGATTQQLDAAGEPIFPSIVHQADAPDIVPPAGLAGVPARGVQLSADVPDDVFALISLTADARRRRRIQFCRCRRARRRTAPPIYQVRFKNRSTIWTYLDKRTGAVNSTEAESAAADAISAMPARSKSLPEVS